jgi:hypothetical protein
MSRARVRLGRYQLVELLGAGGMAEAWSAIDDRGAAVVVKRILPSHAGDPAARRMFLDEARLALALRHPAIVAAIELGEAAGEPFLVLERIIGHDLAQVIGAYARASRPPPAFAAHIAAQVCRALAHAHALTDDAGRPRGLVHRDVSPSNVMVALDGRVKLLDFGVAKLTAEETTGTAPGVRKGKERFMSPEQLEGAPVDARSDLFSVGILLHEACTGRRLDRDAPAALSPPELDRLCRRALSADPAQRPPSAAAMADELETIARALGGSPALVAEWMGRLFAPADETRTAATAPGRAAPRRVRLVWLAVPALLGLAAWAWLHATSSSAPPVPAPIASPVPPAELPAPAAPPPAAQATPTPAAPPPPAAPHKPPAKTARPHAGPPSKDPLSRGKDIFDPF